MMGHVKSMGKAALLIGTALTISMLAVSIAGADERQITNKEEFMRLVAGKKHNNQNGYIVARKDGFLTGNFGKHGEVSGAWDWKDQLYCRSVVVGTRNFGYECQPILISGNKVSYVRKNGTRAVYQLESNE